MSISSTSGLTAAACVVAAMAVLGLTDNLVIMIAGDAGLWQFQLVRSVFGLAMILIAAGIVGAPVRPKRPSAVALRSALVSLSMVFYFGALAFLPVAQTAAGLFTSPIWVLLISVAVMGQRVGLLNIGAVIVGFAGVLMVLQPDFGTFSVALVMPISAGVLYAFGAIATRKMCARENVMTLLVGFFITMILWGLLGCIALAIFQPEVPSGPEGFLLRGWRPVSWRIYGLIALMSVGAVIGLWLIFRAYLLAEAPFVAVFEYSMLIFGGFWGWMIWGQTQNALAFAGIAAIILSGAILARAERATRPVTTALPTS